VASITACGLCVVAALSSQMSGLPLTSWCSAGKSRRTPSMSNFGIGTAFLGYDWQAAAICRKRRCRAGNNIPAWRRFGAGKARQRIELFAVFVSGWLPAGDSAIAARFAEA
jgi:hypothetical protein